MACDRESEERLGKCPGCGQADTFAEAEDEQEEHASEEVPERRRAKRARDVPARLPTFHSTGRAAWDHVLGGGFVRPSSVLVYGPRGVGKSTNALRVASFSAKKMRGPVLYGSAEMPAEHLRMLADRLAIDLSDLWISDSGEAEDFLEDIESVEPAVIVWDSIQRFRWNGALGETELRDVVCAAIRAGVETEACSILISQVTKDETFIGPNGIGHDVDVLVSLRQAGPNLVAVECLDKNRFAPTPATMNEQLY